MAALMLSRIQVDDYETWKSMFDSDPAGARQAAKGHQVLRGLDDPNEVFIRVEFDSTDEATVARERLLASGVLERIKIRNGPTIAVEADAVTY
jgi:hypothetical protein